MKEKKHVQIRGFVTGVIVTVLVLCLVVPAFADTVIKELRVAYGGISIYVDGDLQHPTNASGDPVEAMIYDGTTYLPVRALTNMLTDKAVNWDQDTRSVYIGKMPRTANVGLEEINLLETGKPSANVYTGKNAHFTVLEKEYAPNNAVYDQAGNFTLNSEYTELHGYFTRRDFDLGATLEGTVYFYSIDSHGEMTLLKEYTATPGDEPIQVSVDLMGVNYLLISFSSYTRTPCALYDVYLTPAN